MTAAQSVSSSCPRAAVKPHDYPPLYRPAGSGARGDAVCQRNQRSGGFYPAPQC